MWPLTAASAGGGRPADTAGKATCCIGFAVLCVAGSLFSMDLDTRRLCQRPWCRVEHSRCVADAYSCANTLASADGGMGGNSILPRSAGLSWIRPRSSCTTLAECLSCACRPNMTRGRSQLFTDRVTAHMHACSMSARALLVVPYTDSLSFCLQVQMGWYQPVRVMQTT